MLWNRNVIDIFIIMLVLPLHKVPCCIPTGKISRESYSDKAGPLENLLCSKSWSCVAATGDCLVLSNGAHWMRPVELLCVLMTGVSYRRCMNMNLGICVCVCVSQMLLIQPLQQQVDVYAHFQCLLPLYSCFAFSKALTCMVNLFCL
jgi:hypothetical protein